MNQFNCNITLCFSFFMFICFSMQLFAIQQNFKQKINDKYPLVYENNTRFYIKTNLGHFTPKQRVEEIVKKIANIIFVKPSGRFNYNEACIEIMSPHYSAIRDGNQTTIPDKYLPKTYNAPSFRFFNTEKKQEVK